MIVAEILEKAASLCERGWCQRDGVRDRPDGVTEFCATAAITVFAPIDYDKPLAECRLAEREVQEVLGYGNCSEFSLPEWNDAPERTQAEVVAALRAAAASLRQKNPPSGGGA